MSAVTNYIRDLGATLKEASATILKKAQALPGKAKGVIADKQIRILQNLHDTVDKPRDSIDAREVADTAAKLVESMRNNEVFKIRGLDQKLLDIFFSEKTLEQKVQAIFKLSDPILKHLAQVT